MTVTDIDFPSGLNALADRYDALLCDAWGVIHDGVSLFPGAGDAMRTFRQTRGPVIILTNAPRPSSIIPPQLDRLGLPRDAYDAVVTSGDATRAEIEKFDGAPAYRIGPAKDDALFQGVNVNFGDEASAAFVICTGLVDDQSENPEGYRPLLARLAGRGLPMVCANPDIVVNWGGRTIWCAGALAEIYAELGGAVVYGGKPHPPIYEQAFEAIDAARGAAVDKARILAIGDGLKTDIAGANRAGVDALFIAGEGGVHQGANDPVAVRTALAAANAHALAVMDGLRW